MLILEIVNQLLNAPLLEAGNEKISLLWLLKLLLALIVVAVATSLFKRFLRDRLFVRLGLSQGNREAIATLISYGLGALGFLIVLANGLNLASLAVVLGSLGVGIGFGFQDLTKNLVSGLALLLEGKLQVGDYIEFNGLSGYIKEIALRSTIIQTFDGGDVVVPNSRLVSHEVLNWSYKNYTGKIHLMIRVAQSSETLLVTETLLSSAYMEPAVLYDPPPKVIFKGFGESSLEFELWVWVSRIDQGISVRSALNYIIDYNFRQVGIQLALPQRELWLRNLEERSPAFSPLNNLSGDPAQPISIRYALKQVPYFQYTSDLYLRSVIEAGYRKMLTDSETLFQEGGIGIAVYVVLAGTIEIASVGLGKQLSLHQAGEFFGETPILLDVPYIATARAIGETSLFVIPKPSFEKLLNTCPKLAQTFAEKLSKGQEEYASLRQQLQDLGLLNMVEHHHNFVDWVQTRLEQLFKFSKHTAI